MSRFHTPSAVPETAGGVTVCRALVVRSVGMSRGQFMLISTTQEPARMHETSMFGVRLSMRAAFLESTLSTLL